MELPPGIYVFGTLPELNATLSSEDEPLICEPTFGGLTTMEPLTFEVIVRTAEVEPNVFAIRDATNLCEVPEACCDTSNAGAGDACPDPGLTGCVSVLDPFCTKEWDLLCVQTAVLFCGADCEEAIQTDP